MSPATVTQFLVDITRGHQKNAFATDAEDVLAASPLDDELRRAVREQDIGSLWLAGAHPMALLYFARASGWDNERYYACIAAAELRTGARAAVAPPRAPEPRRTHR